MRKYPECPGLYVLTSDLSCSVSIFIKSDNVTLDFQGHTLTNPNPGLHHTAVITATGGNSQFTTNGVRILNGKITGFGTGITIGGPVYPGAPLTTDAEIHQMTLTGNERGILVGFASGVRLHHNVIVDTVFAGTPPPGSGHGAGIAAFYLTDSQIKNNVISGSSSDGIRLWAASNDNMIMNNTLTGNSRGIVISTEGVSSTGNMIKKNEARSNTGFDLLDENPGCDSNTWKNNTFGTSSPVGCIQ